jgi:hypothetical protein
LRRSLRAWTSPSLQAADHREQAQRLNQLASTIRTPTDARRFVDLVADIFAEQLPPASISNALLERVAQAELSAVTDPQKLIPEQRAADAWNAYAATIQAPEEYRVTPAEIHNLRDSFLASARMYWSRSHYTIWTIPGIYATQADGALASGCRPIESIRLLWDLANMPDNLKGARERVSEGVLLSDLWRQPPDQPASGTGRCYVTARLVPRNPVEVAAREYVNRNGVRAFGRTLTAMLDHALA